MGKLNDTRLRALLRNGPPGKYADGEGLFVRVTRTGSLLWQMKYRNPKENLVSFGAYPSVSLADARAAARKARDCLRSGADPNNQKRVNREARTAAQTNSFEAISREWFAVRSGEWVESYGVRLLRRLELHVFPHLGKRPIASIDVADVLPVLRRIESQGSLETAHRTCEACSQIFRYAMRTMRTTTDPCWGLREALKRPTEKPMPAILNHEKLSAFLSLSRAYAGRGPVVRAALHLMPMLFLRPGELRQGDWSEVDFEKREWRIPAKRMKLKKRQKETGDAHVVFLSTQAVGILRALYEHTGPEGAIFAGAVQKSRPISDGTLNAAIRAMGYDTRTQVTAHGFRATARTLGVEVLKADDRVLEAQLAHQVKDKLGRSYNRTQFLHERQAFMQEWSDYLDRLAARPQGIGGTPGADVAAEPLHAVAPTSLQSGAVALL